VKLAFCSNFMNHHQAKLCEAFYKRLDGNFRFIACAPINAERIRLGYKDMNQEPYVIRAYENQEQKQEAMIWCMESDILIHGSAPEIFVTKRMEAGLPVFKYSERILKKGLIHAFSPRARGMVYRHHTRYEKQPLYMLCASAYTAMDFHRFGVYKDKAFRWGYFPEVKKYPDFEEVLHSKKKNTLLWAGRLLDWKHPEAAITVARRLKEDGIDFSLSLIGNGPMQEQLEQLISKWDLQDHVILLGSMPPEKVREHMEQAEIYLFTSDRGEGWGAVLNESMNSGCAVVASHAIGAVPFLIRDGKNGLIYRDGDVNDLYKKVKGLLDNPVRREALGRAAYDTLCYQWNAEKAAERFVQLAQAICDGEKYPDLFEEGVCSKASLLKDGWYR